MFILITRMVKACGDLERASRACGPARPQRMRGWTVRKTLCSGCWNWPGNHFMPPSFALAGGTQKILELQTGAIPAREALVDRATLDQRTGLVDRRMIIEAVDLEHSPHLQCRKFLDRRSRNRPFQKRVRRPWPSGKDAVLNEVAWRMASGARPYDTVGRFGGERLAIVVPTGSSRRRQAAGGPVSSPIRSTPIEHARGGLPVTASCRILIGHRRNLLDPGALPR